MSGKGAVEWKTLNLSSLSSKKQGINQPSKCDWLDNQYREVKLGCKIIIIWKDSLTKNGYLPSVIDIENCHILRKPKTSFK